MDQNGWPEYKCSPVIRRDHSQLDKTSDIAAEVEWVHIEDRQSDEPPAYEENLEDSGYGEFTIKVEDCSEHPTPTDREPSISPRRSPKCLLEPDEDLLIEALTTPVGCNFLCCWSCESHRKRANPQFPSDCPRRVF